MLGLRGCTGAFFSCGKQGLLSSCGLPASHCGGFSSCEARALEHGLMSCGLVALWHVGSSWIRDGIMSPEADSQLLEHQ